METRQIVSVIVDIDPLQSKEHCGVSLLHLADALNTFLAFFLRESASNVLQVYLSAGELSERIYSSSLKSSDAGADNGQQSTGFALEVINLDIESLHRSLLKSLLRVLKSASGAEHNNLIPCSRLAGALCSSLCYVNKLKKSFRLADNVTSRILVIKASNDERGQHMDLMNLFFIAYKQNVTVDCCALGDSSTFMEQACDITRGMYHRIEKVESFLEYLLWLYVPLPMIRNELVLPPPADVELGPECCCHRKILNIGWVCSVCLSVFCHFSPICSTCRTVFKFMPPPRKERKKKQSS